MNYIYYKDKAAEWRWRLKANNGNIIATSSESYKASRTAYIQSTSSKTPSPPKSKKSPPPPLLTDSINQNSKKQGAYACYALGFPALPLTFKFAIRNLHSPIPKTLLQKSCERDYSVLVLTLPRKPSLPKREPLRWHHRLQVVQAPRIKGIRG